MLAACGPNTSSGTTTTTTTTTDTTNNTVSEPALTGVAKVIADYGALRDAMCACEDADCNCGKSVMRKPRK